MTLSTGHILAVAKAAQEVPMAWLTQSDFPAKTLVKESFRTAAQTLPAWTPQVPYELTVIHSALAGIASGTDPRGGSFKAQAIQAAAQLHDYTVKLLAELVS